MDSVFIDISHYDERQDCEDAKGDFEHWQAIYPLHYATMFFSNDPKGRMLILELLAEGYRLDDKDNGGATPWEFAETDAALAAFLTSLTEADSLAAEVGMAGHTSRRRRI